MYYGIQLSASGALTGLYRTDVLANNLANINTTSFKPDMAFTRQRDTAKVEDGLWNLPSNSLLEKLGAGAHMAPNAVNYAQGALRPTGNDLDLAVQGDGFFVLRTAADGANSGVLFTRDGRLERDSEGRLVNASTGLPVLNVNNRPIQITSDAPVSIDSSGQLSQDGVPLDRIQLVDVEDRSLLIKNADNTYRVSNDVFNQAFPSSGKIEQGMLEGAAINPVAAMLGVQAAAKSVGTNFNMISYQDRMMERAINTFARIG